MNTSDWTVKDMRTGNVVATASTLTKANRIAERKNQAYGAVRYVAVLPQHASKA